MRKLAIVIVLLIGTAAANGADYPETALTISPAKPASPALGNRLFPLESELNPGDAAPIYLRLTGETLPDRFQALAEKPMAWLILPPEKFPKDEAAAFVAGWGPRLDQITYGAHRQTCAWNYTLPEEREHSLEILLPDAQWMRHWGRLLAVKARVEVAENKFGQAVQTMRTGFAFGRHVGGGPFLINNLVGMANIQVMLTVTAEFISRSDAPSLYWPLTALPRPMVSVRAAMANEYKLGEWVLPEMTDLDKPRNEAEWSARLARFHAQLIRMLKHYKIHQFVGAAAAPKSFPQTPKEKTELETYAPIPEDLAGFRTAVMPYAREFLQAHKISTAGMSDDQVVLVYFHDGYHDLWDEDFKAAYLPFPEAEPTYKRGEDKLVAAKKTPLGVFSALVPAVASAHRAEAMLDRKIAAIRIIEALRLHAGETGALPKSLDEIKVVPIPADPVAGKPFGYILTGDTAVITGTMPSGQEKLGIAYRVTLRK